MQPRFPFTLAARACLAWAVGAGAAHAGGIPVFDTVNLQESIKQTGNQSQQIGLQREQLNNMRQNTEKPARYLWDQTTETMGRLRSSMNRTDPYQKQAGGLEAHLQQFKDADGYQQSPCVKTGCDAAQWSQMTDEQARLGARTQKSANDALLRSLAQQEQAMATDADNLGRLQGQAQGANGQMQALGAANQLASHQAHQLQQIRALLVAQGAALAERQQVLADREALALARQQAALAPRMGKTPNPLNWLNLKR